MNPLNVQINASNRNRYVQIDELRSIPENDDEIVINTSDINKMLRRIKSAKMVKKFYIALEFNKMNNPEFQNEIFYSMNLLKKNNRRQSFTPQFNNISMVMPSSPLLYEWNKISKVNFQNVVDVGCLRKNVYYDFY